MSGITAIQAASAAETWEAWQALMQASLAEGESMSALEAGLPQLPHPSTDAVAPLNRLAEAGSLHPAHQAQPTAADANAQAAPAGPAADTPTVAAPFSTPASHDKAQLAAPPPVQSSLTGLVGDPAVSVRLADASSTVLPMAPVLMTPLTLQEGPELRWRAQDVAAWRQLFDDAGGAAQDEEEEEVLSLPGSTPEDGAAEAMPPWAQLLLARLHEATSAPLSAAALRPALQAWRVGLPVLLACPAGLIALQPSRDAQVWQWRRWPARWRSARPATAERWWAVRVGLGTQGRPRTLRDATGGTALAPGQVSCELRLDGVAPGIAQWTEVLVQAAGSASLRSLLAARPSMTWLLCNQPLWPREIA